MKRVLLVALLIALVVAVYSADGGRESTSSNDLPATNTPPALVEEKAVEIIFQPAEPIQGEPVIISILGTSSVSSISFNKKNLGTFSYQGNPSALVGLDLRVETGEYPVTAILPDGSILSKNLKVGKRTIVQAPLGIPDKLGGDTPEAEKELINTLAQEGAIINAIPVSSAQFWKSNFRLPINPPITITDVYGYSRLTGASTIAHKGTDFRAATGTPVYIMSDGLVRYVGFMRNYGNVIAVDHGTGILTIYMHLSEVLVKEGDWLSKGALIARSGETGYVLGPHLHLTVRINGVSVDPLKFMELLGEK